jgi:hypothetical protein
VSTQAGAQASRGPQPPTETTALADALRRLRAAVGDIAFPLALPAAAAAATTARQVAAQLDDYLLPRLSRLDAPLLVVVGGSTGAGKSTLVNSLVQAPVTTAGVLRPTTRAPVLVCNPEDENWFASAELLPGLERRVSLDDTGPDTLRIMTAPALEPGLALLDSPDIDSVVDANHALAHQLLAAADLWLFLTTAARYADAVPWSVLRRAQDRGTVIALVLDRVPPGAEAEVAEHLSDMLRGEGLGSTPLFVIPEDAVSGSGLLPDHLVAPLRDWLRRLARDAAARAAVVRQTLDGAIAAVEVGTIGLASAAVDQVVAVRSLTESARLPYRDALDTVEHAVRDGTLLRGEVLARWQEFVGTGELMRALHSRIGRWRDRVTAAVTGRTSTVEPLQQALTSGLAALVVSAATDAAEQAHANWRTNPAGGPLLEGTDGLDRPSANLPERVERLVREWQRGVLDLVRTEGAERKRLAQLTAYTVNATGLLLMVAVFASTAFIPTGMEVAVAGGTTVAAQKVLEAVFGDQATRELARKAQQDLMARVRELFDQESARLTDRVAGVDLDEGLPRRLRDAADAVARARRAAGLATHAALPDAPRLPSAGPVEEAPADPDQRSIFELPDEVSEDDLRPGGGAAVTP